MTDIDMPEIDELAWEAAAAEHERAIELLDSGDLEAAAPVALGAAEALRGVVGEQHPDYANALATVAQVSEQLGNLHEAIELGLRALAILDQYRDEPIVDPMRAAAATQVGYRLALAGRYTESETLLREALALTPEQHPQEANAWVNLGVSLRLAGRHDEATTAYGRACELYVAANDPLPPALHHNLAGLAFARGDHALSESHARSAIAARERARETGETSETDEFELGMDLCGLGDALAGLGRFSEAEQAYRDGLACYERVGRAEHVEVAFALHNLADVLADQARVDEAETTYRRAIALKLQLLGDAHHEVAATLSNLAVLVAGCERLDEARALSEKARAIVSSLDERHPVRIGVEAAARTLAS
jgi:tetratricopeptide (TPR) repeat protein